MGCDQVGGKSALLPDRSSLECGGPRRTDSELRAVRRLINHALNWTTSIDVMYPGGPPPAPASDHRYRAGLRRQRIDETAPIFVTRTFALRTSSTPENYNRGHLPMFKVMVSGQRWVTKARVRGQSLALGLVLRLGLGFRARIKRVKIIASLLGPTGHDKTVLSRRVASRRAVGIGNQN